MKETVAVLGTGKMGTALVRAFAAAGHSVVAWNRTPARAEPLRTVAALASTPATAARDASLLVASSDGLWRLWPGALYRRDGRVAAGQDSCTAYERNTCKRAHRRRVGSAARCALSRWRYPRATELHRDRLCDRVLCRRPDVFDAHKQPFKRWQTTLYTLRTQSAQRPHSIAGSGSLHGGCLAFLHAAAMCESEGVSSSRFFEYKRTFITAIDVTVDAASADARRA